MWDKVSTKGNLKNILVMFIKAETILVSCAHIRGHVGEFYGHTIKCNMEAENIVVNFASF